MKKILMLLTLFIPLVLIPLIVSAEEKATVVVGALCPLEVVKEDAKKLTTINQVAPGFGCIPVRAVEVPILEVVSEAYRDTDGDVFYIVKVSENPDLYTIAWPGFNSTLKKTIGI